MKKIVALLCALLVMGGSAQALEVSAPSALLMEKETGTVLFAKDEHAKLEPASVTKVMTLLLVMEAIDSGALALRRHGHRLRPRLLHGRLPDLAEGERADDGRAICSRRCAWSPPTTAPWPWRRHVAGSEEAFVEKMNQRAAELGMEDTHFCQRHGPAGGGPRHLRLRHRPDEPGADPATTRTSASSPPSGWTPCGTGPPPWCNTNQPDPLLRGGHGPEDRLHGQRPLLPLRHGGAGRHGADRRDPEGPHLHPAL